MVWRLHAQRLLIERQATDVVDSLVALIADSNVDSLGLNVGAIHGLWVLAGIHETGMRSEVRSWMLPRRQFTTHQPEFDATRLQCCQ